MRTKPVLGILTWREGKRFSEPKYLRRLVLAGQRLGAETFLFSHQDVNSAEKKIRGFVPVKGGGWESRLFPWPDVVIDRYRKRVDTYLRLRHSGLFQFANSPFGKKWRVTEMLAKEERVKHWIPKTVVYAAGKVKAMLKHHKIVYVKPGNGTGGRSIVKIMAQGDHFLIRGRNRRLSQVETKLGSVESVEKWIRRWVREQRIGDGNFLVQQGLDLELVPDRVADVRLLIQKKGDGEWDVTGSGVRLGPAGSSISNLHGGGKPISFSAFMNKCFGEERALEIHQECQHLAHEVAVVLEQKFGRMMEFGLDVGVDVLGAVWLIEVNPKPGREIFSQMGDSQTYAEAIARPVSFALHLVSASGSEENSDPKQGRE
ncbi:YheC/YheD family protein [Brevibacillus ruminantium]|uniref:YheC/YheD family protein n=1 Tax=Brevibacillus ruminantium TaxID=2950604 RepID=A0ABY4WM30_9BACL|nr:YheC/YheD family protein [Brevibacillus ruminantium]USG67178.1 YheC/YheD family protein [Brevibacillus ruminantium]